MKPIYIKEALGLPKTVLNKELGIFEICGNSFMSNPFVHYTEVINWLKEYVKNPLPETKFSFDLEYANSATLKLLNDIINILLYIPKINHKLEIIWYYSDDDDDMKDVGKLYEKINKFPFTFIKK